MMLQQQPLTRVWVSQAHGPHGSMAPTMYLHCRLPASCAAIALVGLPTEWFTTAPSVAIPKALARAGLQQQQIDFFEINQVINPHIGAGNRGPAR
jgi:hypothetical protein